jgi:hypothetical protein
MSAIIWLGIAMSRFNTNIFNQLPPSHLEYIRNEGDQKEEYKEEYSHGGNAGGYVLLFNISSI